MKQMEILKKFFSREDLPNTLEIGKHARITDMKKFVETSFKYLESNSGNKAYLPYFNHLVEVYEILKNRV